MKMRKLLVLLLILILGISLAACDKTDDKEAEYSYTQPQITEASKVEFTSSYKDVNYSISKKDLYTMVRYYGGIGLLLQEIDEHLLSSIISTITTVSPEYVSRYNRLLYSTDDADEIAKLSAEEKATALQEYNYTMYIMGLSTAAAQESYIKLLAARDIYTRTYLEEVCQADPDNDYYITEENLKTYYEEEEWDDTKALVINFDSQNDFREALLSLGLVIYNSELRKYTGVTPIADVYERQLSEENTLKLTEAETQAKFIELYNLVYSGYKTEVTAANIETLAELDYNYDELYVSNTSLAEKLFAMEAGDYTYTIVPYTVSYGTAYTIMYKIVDEDKVDFEDITEAKKEAILDKAYDALVATSSVVTAALVHLRSEKGITFNDRFFAQDYAASYDTTYVTTEIVGDETVLVKLNDGFDVTADEYYDYATSRNKAYYILNAAVVQIEQITDSYSMLYGDEKVLANNASKRYISYYDTLKDDIEENATSYELEEDYIYETYGYTTFEDVINYYYASNDLKTFVVYDLLFGEDENENIIINAAYEAKLQEVLDEYYDNYYDLYSYELTVYTDYDSDYAADDLAEVIENIDNYSIKLYDVANQLITDKAEKQAAYKAKLNEFYAVVAAIATGKDSDEDAVEAIEDFIKEYNASSRFDATNPYKEYKDLGFKLSYQTVVYSSSSSSSSSSTTTTSITYANYKDTATEAMNEAYIKIFADIANGYSKYVAYNNISYVLTTDTVLDATKTYYTLAEDVYTVVAAPDVANIATYYEKINDISFVVDENGAHYIVATPGAAGSSYPKFDFNETSDDSSNTYNDYANNDTVAPTLTQLVGALHYSFYEIILTSETVALEYGIEDFPQAYPSDVDMDDFVSAVESYYYSNNFINSFFADVLSSNAEYAETFEQYEVIYTYFLNNN